MRGHCGPRAKQVDAGLASVGASRLHACQSWSFHAEDEDQEKRFQALYCASDGSFKRGQAFKRHILTKKTTKNKRQLRGTQGRP